MELGLSNTKTHALDLDTRLPAKERKGRAPIRELLPVADLPEIPSRNTVEKNISKATQAFTSLLFQAHSERDLELT